MNFLKQINWHCKEFYGFGFSKVDLVKGSLNRAVEKFGDKPVVCCEIGVYKGIHAKQILEKLNVKALYLIDPYENYEGYKTKKNNFHKILRKAQDYLKQYPQAVFLRQYSSMACKCFLLGSLDYVYIDGNHDYLYVKADLENYYPFVKVGGIIGGDDIDRTDVIQAVFEFAFENNLKVNVGGSNWWIER